MSLEETVNPVRYACLSHCWGNPKTLIRTTLTNKHQHITEGVTIEVLPKTYRDAILVCRKIEVDYLWIDSLCIVQDDDQDWREQASRMGDVYENAFVTIAAVTAQDASQGLFRTTPDFRIGISMQKFPWIRVRQQARKPGNSDYKLAQTTHSGDSWPLYRRGWTYQELSLSPRVLHFGPEEVIWSCRGKLAFEGDPALDQYLSNAVFTNRDLARKQWSPQETWQHVVQGYSFRKLTFERDKLPAIAAFVSRIKADHPEKQYIAGLWEETLHFDLLWHGSSLLDPSQLPRWRKPTWSWISVRYSVSWPIRPDLCQYLPCTKIVRTEYITRGLPILGDIVEASLTIEAPIIKLKQEFWHHAMRDFYKNTKDYNLVKHFHREDNTTGPIFLEGPHWECEESDIPKNDDPNAKTFAIPLIGLRRGGNPRGHKYFINALLVKETDEPGEYRRIGTGFVHFIEGCVLARLSPGDEAQNGMHEDTLVQARAEADARLIEELGRMDTQKFKLI